MARRIVTAREQHEMLLPWRMASGFDPMAVTNRLKGEFTDWFHSLPDDRLDEIRNIEMHPFMDHHENNPVSHWPTVERFLKDKYPAAHRGFMTGREDASMWLDDPNNDYETPMLEGDDEFGSLPPPEPYSSADHEKLGYDPQEVAAGMVLLHNRAHSGRQDSYLNTDKKRLVDIYNKRQQMQRQYEQRTGATYWHITDHPDFKPDPDYSPELNTTMGGEMKPGLFLTRNPSHWMQGYGYWRPYVSEIEAPDDIGEGSHLSPERYVPAEQYHRMHVKRTIPIDAYSREHYNEPGWVENSFGYDFQSGSPLDSAPGGYHKRNWDGRYHYPGTAMDQPEEWRKSYEQRVRDYQQRTPGIIARTAASDLDDILELLGQPGRADYTRPSPREQHEPIPGVPLGWERYVTELSGQEPGEAHLHLPVHVLDHYKEYDRDPHSEQAQALSHMLNTEGIRNPVHISTDGTHALMYEGNNRLAVAKQLGITHLPVRVTYEKPGRVIRNEGTPVPLEKTLGSWVAANKHHLKPFFEGG